ncbi:MAG: hypothetical protein ACFFB2_06200 [Promethearchaeota archaeon]
MGKMKPLILGSLLIFLVLNFYFILSLTFSSTDPIPCPTRNNDMANSKNPSSNLLNLAHPSQNNGLAILFPNGGETLTGTVTIQWILDVEFYGDDPWYSVFYSPNGGEDWIQLAFTILETTHEWDTPLYETYGTNYLVKVIAGSKNWEEKEDISDHPFTIDNREERTSTITTTSETTAIIQESDDNQFLLLISLFGSLILISGVGFTYFRTNPRFKPQVTFVELVQSSKTDYLNEIRHKVIIGLDNIRTDYPSDFRDVPRLESVSQTSMVEYFPTSLQNDLRSELKGRTVLTLIEIAYQNPRETNPTKLAQSLQIPAPTLTREIKKLIDLQYVETYVSAQVIQDARFRNFSITPKGFLFLSTLKEALQITITRLKEKQL